MTETLPQGPLAEIEKQIIDLEWSPEPGWQESLLTFRSRGLTVFAMRRLINVSETAAVEKKLSSEDVWKYFCGCCWRTLKSESQSSLGQSSQSTWEGDPDDSYRSEFGSDGSAMDWGGVQ